MRQLDGITDAMDMNLGKPSGYGQGERVLQSMVLQRVGDGWVAEQ